MKKQLSKDAEYIRTSLLWDSEECDLDISAFLLDRSGKAQSDKRLIFYNNAFAEGKALIYGGDNRGEPMQMAETILVQLGRIPDDVSKVAFCVTVSDEGKTFGSAGNARFVVGIVSDPYDKGMNPLCTVNLSESHAGNVGMVVFELTRSASAWKYEQVSQSVKGGLEELCKKFGLEVM